MVEEAENKSKISIWWDIENCHVPKDVDPHYVAQNMKSALHHANLTGPIEIQAFGDTKILPHVTQKALSDTGITLNHVPRGNKDAADKAILVGMLLWALDNPPPANILLISGDGDFANALHRLRLKTYSILLAVPAQFVKPALTGAAKKLWFWKDMAKGQLAEPEVIHPGSNPSAQELPGSRSMDSLQKRELSSGLMAPVTLSSVVPTGYASPQKRTISEHFRSLSLENHPSSVFCENRSSSCGPEIAHNVALDRKVPSGVSSISAFSNATLNQCRPPVLAAHSMDVGQYPYFMPQAGQRIDSAALSNNIDGSKLQHIPNVPAGSLPRGPLKHIGPNNNRGTENIPIAMNTIPESKFNHKAHVHKGEATEYQNLRSIDSPYGNTSPSSWPSSAVANNLENLPHDMCVDKIYSAMKTLERDMLAPTENNLSDCIQYWDQQYERVDLKQTLKTAAELKQVTKTQLGGGLVMYFPPDHMTPWNCVDPGNMNLIHHLDAWVELNRFLLYGEKKQVLLSSCSRYGAAVILKTACGLHIQKMVVGKILNLLQQAIQEKKWLRKVGLGWGPLILNQKVLLDWFSGETRAADLRPPTNQSGPAASVRRPVPPASVKKASDKDALFTKLTRFLCQILKNGNVYNLSLLPRDFELATGTPLDCQKLGYSNLHELMSRGLSDFVSVETSDSGLPLLRWSGLMGFVEGHPIHQEPTATWHR